MALDIDFLESCGVSLILVTSFCSSEGQLERIWWIVGCYGESSWSLTSDVRLGGEGCVSKSSLKGKINICPAGRPLPTLFKVHPLVPQLLGLKTGQTAPGACKHVFYMDHLLTLLTLSLVAWILTLQLTSLILCVHVYFDILLVFSILYLCSTDSCGFDGQLILAPLLFSALFSPK